MKTASSKIVNRAPTVRPAASPEAVRRRVETRSAPAFQAALRVSSPADPAEKEAESTAKRVMRTHVPEGSVAFVPRGAGGVFRQVAPPRKEKELLRQEKEPEEKLRRQVKEKEREGLLGRLLRRALPKEEERKLQRQAAPKEEEKKLLRQALPKEEERKLQRQAVPKEEKKVLRQVKEREKEGLLGRVLRRTLPKEREMEGVARQAKPKEEKRPEAEIRRSWRSPHALSLAPAVGKRKEEEVRRKAEGVPDASSNVASEIQGSLGAGEPLPLSVRRFMEPRFGADFGGVRVHTGERAAALNRGVNARAFAYGSHLFFGRDQYRPETEEGKELIAHELTHTIQQGGSVQRADEAAVSQTSAPQVQRLGIGDALDYFADKANLIPGFRMFTIVLGVNPINMSRVDRSAANVLRAVVEFIPGGGLITRALDAHGVFERVGGWVEGQLRTLGLVGASIRQAVMDFLDSLSWRDIFRLGSVWERAKRIFTAPIDRIKSFVRGLIGGILDIIKEVILRPLARLAEGTRGYDLLKAILGQDPITGDPYPRNADTLIGGFMKLIGQEEVWQNLKRANAVARAWAWFQGALAGLLGFVRQIPALFLGVLRSLGISDLVALPTAFGRVVGVFTGAIGRFFSWAGAQVLGLLQIIFEVVAPGAMPYLRRIGGAFQSIIRNPIGFVGNLVRAGLLGFRQFARNFLTHLRTSLIGWLTGTMAGAGIYIPQAFNLREIIKFVLSVLGLTWQNIRQKLVRVIGETAVAALESGFELVRTLVTQGPAAAWEQIQQGITNLQEMVMGQVMAFVQTRIVQAAITRLLTSLNPAGAFVQAVIAIYNTVMFFVERLRQISQVAMSFLNSMAAIASGAIGAAANRVEQTMGGLLTLVISFLARLVGLGRVSDAVKNIIDRIRQPIDRALDRVVDWIVAQARRLGRLIAGTARGAVAAVTQWWRARVAFTSRRGQSHRLFFVGEGAGARLKVASAEMFTEEFVARIQAVFVDDLRARALGASSLSLARDQQQRVDRIMREMAGLPPASPRLSVLQRNLQSEMASLGASMAVLVDLLPENQDEDFPVRPGQYVSLPVGGRNLRAEILVASRTGVQYRAEAARTTSRMPAAEFRAQWDAGVIRLASGAPTAVVRAYLTEHYGARVAEAVMRRGELAERIGSAGVGEAHHIIPVEVLLDNEIVQRLVNSGWNFNEELNGIPLQEGFHGNHPAYSAYVGRRIRQWREQQSGVVADLVPNFRSFVRGTLIPELRALIERAQAEHPTTGVNLNAFFARL